MLNTRCMLCLELADGTMLPVNESRLLCEKLMRRGIVRPNPATRLRVALWRRACCGSDCACFAYLRVGGGQEPHRVYAHAYEDGDVLLTDNWAVWHSATGGLAPEDRRVMHLSSWDGSRTPR